MPNQALKKSYHLKYKKSFTKLPLIRSPLKVFLHIFFDLEVTVKEAVKPKDAKEIAKQLIASGVSYLFLSYILIRMNHLLCILFKISDNQ